MTKSYEFSLDSWQVPFFFKPLRKKEDVLIVLLEAVKTMLIYEAPSDKDKCEGKFYLKISKMSRLIFEGETKIFSINFPFKVLEDQDGLRFVTQNNVEIDNFLTSEVLAFVSQDSLMDSEDFLDFASPIIDGATDEKEFWNLIKDLFFYEDGYLRFDHDEEHIDGHHHPLDHFDFFYSNGATLKIGVERRYSVDKVIDVLDVTTPCHYLRSVV